MWKNSLLFLYVFFATISVAPSAFAACDSSGYPNPIAFCDIPSFVLYLAGAVIKIVIPIAILLVIFIGFRFVAASARGDIGGIATARKLLLWTLIGTAVIVGAAAIAYGFVNFVRTL